MKSRSVGIRCIWLAALAGVAVLMPGTWLLGAEASTGAAAPGKPPSHQVLACYFHRTKRCPTCKTISAYIEEALKTRFADQMKTGEVKLYMIDFQDKKNERYTKAYKITRPTLVLLDVRKGKVAQWKKLEKVWGLFYKKDAFFRYVEEETQTYLTGRDGVKAQKAGQALR